MPFEDIATAGSSLEEWNWVLQKVVYASNQHLVYCTVSPTVRIHRSRNQGVEKAITVLTITPSNPLGKFLLPVPVTLSSAGLEVWFQKGNTPARSHSKHSIELEAQTSSWPL